MTKYYFVRHGESTANVDRVSAGWSDVALTENGINQAYKTAKEIKDLGIKFDVIISSPLSRALDTAKIIAKLNNYPEQSIKLLDKLKEKSAGSMELGPISVIFDKTEQEFKEMGGENAEMFRDRVRIVLEEIKKLSKGCNIVLIVAHSGIYKMAEVIDKKLEPATTMYDVEVPKNADFIDFPLN